MPERMFTHKNVTYHLFAYGTPDNYYGQAEKDGGNIYTRLDRPARTIEGAFDCLISNIKEKVDAHRYDVGGEMLIGTVRACGKLITNPGEKPYAIQTFIGRLGFANQGGKHGNTISYVEGANEQEAYDLLDKAADSFAAKDGFRCIRRN